MSSIIKSPFINYASNNKKIIRVSKEDPNIIGQGSNKDNSINRQKINAMIEAEKRKAEKVANNIINKAMNDAECIVQDAKHNAITISEQAHKKALEEGYQEGLNKGEHEAIRIKEEANIILQQAHAEKNKILSDIEPSMVFLLKKLLKSLTNYVIDKDEIILYLIRKGFSEIEILDNVIIHVAPDDFDSVNKNKDKLCENISEKVSVEILKDETLVSNDCIIETKAGNIDCSLSTRLSGLMADLELITNSLKS